METALIISKHHLHIWETVYGSHYNNVYQLCYNCYKYKYIYNMWNSQHKKNPLLPSKKMKLIKDTTFSIEAYTMKATRQGINKWNDF